MTSPTDSSYVWLPGESKPGLREVATIVCKEEGDARERTRGAAMGVAAIEPSIWNKLEDGIICLGMNWLLQSSLTRADT